MKPDLRSIKTQADLEYLFNKTSFSEDESNRWFGSQFKPAIKIDKPDEDGYQYPHIGECEYMGSVTVADFEDSGFDALFVQTLVQMFATGKLVVKE